MGFFQALVHTLTAAFLAAQVSNAIEVTAESGLAPSYDYIVVGGGTSGLAVGVRLAETSKSVLIIEAGPFDQHEETIYHPHLAFSPGGQYDWRFPAVPQEFIANGNATITRGKIVGGSSALNAMVFDRGAPGDYDSWEKLGNPGWGWEGMLPYFKKSETFTPVIPPLAKAFNITHVPSFHGDKGPVQSSYPPFIYDTNINVRNAFNSIGIETPEDHAESALGAFYFPTSLDPKTQTRSFSRTAYWDPAAEESNLHILTSTMVLRIVTDNSGEMPRATGVEILPDGGSSSIITANEDIILAAGAIQSPQLLQVSGIGPKALLDSLEIPVVVDLPGVGANFQDHPIVSAPWSTTNISFSPANLTSDPALDAVFRRMYETTLTGPWTVGVGNFLAMVPLKDYAENAESLIAALRDQTSTFLAENVDSTVTAGYLRQKEVMIEMMEAKAIATLEMVVPGLVLVLQHAMSRGSIYIDSPDMTKFPKIDWRVFTNPIDRQMLASAIRFGRKVNLTPHIQELGAVEGPAAGLETDEELLPYIYQFSGPSISHPSGTCSMMPLELGGVVDTELRVYGISGLRIVDASIMPMIPSAPLQATVYAVAEKAADIIKQG